MAKQLDPNNPWYGIPVDISGKMTTTPEAQAYWDNQNTPDPTDIATPTPTPTTQSYSRLPATDSPNGTTNAQQAAQMQYGGNFSDYDANGNKIQTASATPANLYPVTDPLKAEQDYTTAQIKNSQSRIDEITTRNQKQLQDALAAQAPVNANSLGRTNALSSLMGLSGSSTAGTRTAVTEKSNADINSSITNKYQAQQATELNAIYDRIDQNAQDIYKSQLETNKENQKAQLDAASKNALDNISAMAQTLSTSGKTFDDFKSADPDTLATLEEQTGKSEYQLRQAWNAALPDNMKPTVQTTYHDDGSGNTIMQQVSFDPVTKKATVNSYPIAAPISSFTTAEKPIEGKNGELFVKQADGSYKDVSPNADNNKKLGEAQLKNEQAQGFEKPFVTGKSTDEYGNSIDTYGIHDKNGNIIPVPTTAGVPNADVADEIKSSNDYFGEFTATLSPQGATAFNALNDQDKSNVQSLIEGDTLLSDIAKGGVKGTIQAQRLNALARQIDPTFSENVNKQRYTFKTQWNNTNGKAYNVRAGVNTGLQHLSRLKELTDQLSTTDFSKYNSITQWIAKNINGPQAETVAQYQDTVALLATEIAKAYKGGAPDQLEVQQQINSINAIAPKNVLTAIINNKSKLMSGLLASQSEEYKKVMGKYPDSVVDSTTLDTLRASGIDIKPISKVVAHQLSGLLTGTKYTEADIEEAINGGATIDDITSYINSAKSPGFSSVGGDTNSATVKKVSTIQDGVIGGQCGRFVNNITGLGLGDSYQSKIAKMDPSVKVPKPGMVFVMPYKNTGHTGIIMAVNNGMATVKDSNYSLDGKVKTHQIPVSKMTGFTYA